MNAVRNNQFLRLAVVIAAVVAWFTLTNHCALTNALAAVGPAEHSCCDKTPAPPAHGPMDGEGSMECCHSLLATAPDLTPAAKMPPLLGEAWTAFVTTVFMTGEAQSAAETDTGPPRALTFTEVVLNRSLLAHAPPQLA